MSDQQWKSWEQEQLAKEGKAEGQCRCGSYRYDGQPPVLHYPGCTVGPDVDAWVERNVIRQEWKP